MDDERTRILKRLEEINNEIDQRRRSGLTHQSNVERDPGGGVWVIRTRRTINPKTSNTVPGALMLMEMIARHKARYGEKYARNLDTELESVYSKLGAESKIVDMVLGADRQPEGQSLEGQLKALSEASLHNLCAVLEGATRRAFDQTF